MANQGTKVLAITCGVLALLGGLFAAGLGFFMYSQKGKIEEGVKNPDEGIRTILGAEHLPEGYVANLALRIPFITDTAILSNLPNTGEKPPQMDETERGFIYNKVKLLAAKDREKLEAYFSGKSQDSSVLRANHINIDFSEEDVLTRGVLQLDTAQVMYLVARKGTSSLGINAGLVNVMLFNCPDDDRFRFGLWYTPEQPIEETDGSFDMSGTVGDEAKIRAFLGHFQFCGEIKPKEAAPTP